MDYGFSKRLYPIQKEFIKRAIEIIENGKVGILSSPTGTGKTISLLCAALHYIKKFDYDDDLYSLLNDRSCTKIFYCSRTHSQLNQALLELKGNKNKYKSVILGSRKIYCINSKCTTDKKYDSFEINNYEEKIINLKKTGRSLENRIANINIINEKCKNLIKNDACQYYKNTFYSTDILDIEDLTVLGKEKGFCPYYYSRNQASKCEIVFLPYNLLFTNEGRKSLEITLENKILIIDEAHNIYDTITQLNSAVLNWVDIKIFLSVKNLSAELTTIITRLLEFKKQVKKEEIQSVPRFLIMSKLSEFNMLDVEEYILNKKFAEKNELIIFYELAKFLKLLTFSDEFGRVIYNLNYIKFMPLNPAMYMEELKTCKSIIFTGGTMEPISQLVEIFPDLVYQSFPAISRNFVAMIVTKYVNGKEARLTYNRRDEEMDCLINTLVMLTNPIHSGGIIIFLPSKSFLELVRNNKKIVNFKRRVKYEDKITLDEYKMRPDILFAVMGGKLSEGTNFSDDMCRLLVIVGVPYPTKDIENIERNKYSEDYSSITAMKIVNQTIGRALRHKNDYASIMLLDSRYVGLRKSLSPWINKEIKLINAVEAMVQTNNFLKAASAKQKIN